jgi:hypothetical protein
VDAATGEVELDAPLGNPQALDGRFVNVQSASGRTERWKVLTAEADGQVLRMDLDHSTLVVTQGPIERVENPRMLVTRLLLPADLPLGTTVRIGPVGDFGAIRHRLESFTRSGFPLRFGGTIVNGLPRELYLGLDITAKLTSDLAGQMLWVSGIEPGDAVFTEPVTVRTWHRGGE